MCWFGPDVRGIRSPLPASLPGPHEFASDASATQYAFGPEIDGAITRRCKIPKPRLATTLAVFEKKFVVPFNERPEFSALNQRG